MKSSNLKIIVRRAVPIVIGLSLSSIPATVAADSVSMPGMDMSGTAMSGSASSKLPVTATLKPNPPIVGDNTLDIMITNPAGSKPVTGLKLQASVAMTSMDMGTTHPKVKELGKGYYSLVATFSMAGPWRVSLSGEGKAGKISTALDFEAGSKTPWKGPKASSPATGSGSTAASNKPATSSGPMAGMDMGGANSADASAAASGMGSMKMGSGTASASGKSSGMNGMTYPMRLVPRLQEKGVMTVTGNENWKARTGFGHNEPMVAMMDSMMVGGSPMESMKMAPMKMDFGPSNYTDQGGNTAMPGMDMGGMKMQGAAASTNSGPGESAAGLKVSATISTPKVGENKLEVTVMNSKSQPITGAKITTSVAMTSMDMGASHPALKESGKGHYAGAANFSMGGPWRVTVEVTAPGQKAETHSFDFNPKG